MADVYCVHKWERDVLDGIWQCQYCGEKWKTRSEFEPKVLIGRTEEKKEGEFGTGS